jgi:hypothetical protein
MALPKVGEKSFQRLIKKLLLELPCRSIRESAADTQLGGRYEVGEKNITSFYVYTNPNHGRPRKQTRRISP